MKATILTTAFLGLCLFLPAKADGLDGLYFKMTMAFGTINQDHWWFLPDGRYLNSVPANGLEPSVFESNCQKTPSVCGTYQIQGAKLQLTPRKGPAQSLEFKQRPDGNIELDGHFTKHVDRFPSNTTLTGHYSWAGSASGGGTSVSAARGYQFDAGGKFTTSTVAGVSGAGQSINSSAAGSGTYKLSGNILELTSEGKTTRYTAYPYDLGNGDIRLNINGEMFKRDR